MFSKKDLTNIEGIMMLYAVKMHASKRHAAKYLNVSLDTLDKYIHILEDEVGAKLLIASGKGCRLTLQGDKILQNIDPIKKCIQNIYNIKEMETDIKGEVHVAYDLNMRGIWHTRLIQHLFNEYPEIILCVDNVQGISAMKNIEYDICLSYEKPEEEDLVVITSREIPCKFFASLKYLEVNSYPENLEDLISNHQLILRKENWAAVNGGKSFADKPCRGVSFTNSGFMVEDMAVNNGGIAVMPYYLGQNYNNLICLENLACGATNTLYLISHTMRKDIPKVRIVLNYYKNVISHL